MSRAHLALLDGLIVCSYGSAEVSNEWEWSVEGGLEEKNILIRDKWVKDWWNSISHRVPHLSPTLGGWRAERAGLCHTSRGTHGVANSFWVWAIKAPVCSCWADTAHTDTLINMPDKIKATYRDAFWCTTGSLLRHKDGYFVIHMTIFHMSF